jgi:RNA polymerase sigma-70 factor (ECF subfamily)
MSKAADSSETNRLLKQVAGGDAAGWNILLTRYRQRLRRMVAFRLDCRLRGRIDASDVLQEAYLEASDRLADYLQNPSMPFYLWLRFLTRQRMLILHRRHLGRARDAGREVSLHAGTYPATTSAALAAQLLGQRTRPSEAAIRAEMKIRLQEALNSMDPLDREVLTLRHFEHLGNADAAHELGIQESAASKRYLRALRHLKEILITIGGLGEMGL